MAYEMVMPYHLHMPSYFLETFTEYPEFARIHLLCGIRQKHSAPTGNTMVVKKLIRQPRQDQQLVEAWESCQNTVTVCRNFHFLSCIFHFNLITGEIIIPFACNGESNGICSIGLAEVSGN